MRYCIPRELFNGIPYPLSGNELVEPDGIFHEVMYKLPGTVDTEVRREIWHSICDFCTRTGALLKRVSASGLSPAVSSVDLLGSLDAGESNLKFMRVVGLEAKSGDTPKTDFYVKEGGGVPTKPYVYFGTPGNADTVTEYRITFSACPYFADKTVGSDGAWRPKVPRYIVERYGECITHGALMRIYALRGAFSLAQMHATAYNEDLLRHSYGLITSGMRKHLMVDMEDVFANAAKMSNAQGVSLSGNG